MSSCHPATVPSFNGGCDTQELINSITRQLSGASPCEDMLLELVPVYWELTSEEGCYSNFIHMLLTKREVILAMMGCEAASVDSYDKHRVLDGRTTGGSQSTIRTQAQSTGNSAKYSIGHGETRYDETNTARQRRDMDRHAKSVETGDGVSDYADDGRGGGYNNSGSWNEIDAVETNLTQNHIDGASTETGYRTDCNYEYSTNNTNGRATGLIVPLVSAATFSFTGSGSEWRKFTKTRAYDQDLSTQQTNWSHEHDIKDERRGQGTHGWSSFFQADVRWEDRDYEVRTNHDRSDTIGHSEAHAQGNGDGLSEDKDEAKSASQSTAKSEYKSDSNRVSTRVDNITATTLANSQRFKNLQRLYDQLTEQIQRATKRYIQNARPSIGTLSCQCQSCCRCLGEMYGTFCRPTNRPIGAGGMW